MVLIVLLPAAAVWWIKIIISKCIAFFRREDERCKAACTRHNRLYNMLCRVNGVWSRFGWLEGECVCTARLATLARCWWRDTKTTAYSQYSTLTLTLTCHRDVNHAHIQTHVQRSLDSKHRAWKQTDGQTDRQTDARYRMPYTFPDDAVDKTGRDCQNRWQSKIR